MRICVAHETIYRYDSPQSGVIQTLRLTPRNHAGQYVVDWRIEISADCRLESDEDAFGNLAHAFSANGPISELRVMVEGEVETQDTAGVVHGAVERFPPTLFLRETALTSADRALAAYAAEIIPIEKIGVAAFANGEDQLPGPARGHDIERGRCGSAEIKVAMIEVAPV